MRYLEPDFIVKKRFVNKNIPHWDIAVICFRDNSGSMELIKTFDAKPVGYKILFGLDEYSECPFVYEKIINDNKVLIITRCIWGGPQAAIIVEELAFYGIKYIIGYGAAGSLDDEFKRGDQIFASFAFPTDGTSKIYKCGHLEPDNIYIDFIKLVEKKLSCKIKEIKIATIDALYRETEDYILSLKKDGAQAINMETSPFYSSSIICGIKSIWIGHISDCLLKKWDDWYMKREEMSNLTSRICLDIVMLIRI